MSNGDGVGSWVVAPGLLWLLGLLALPGCHSHFIQATIENDTGQPLRVVELDYPSASFGVSTLAPHASYIYRFKAQGSAPLTLTYTDNTGAAHTATGPVVHEGEQGSVSVRIGNKGAVSWQPSLTSR